MPNRYFTADPQVMAMLQFFAGRGQQQGAYDQQQYQAEMARNQQLAGTAASGVQAGFRANVASQQLQQAGEQRQALQQQRIQGQVYRDAVDQYTRKYGHAPPSIAGGVEQAFPQPSMEALGVMEESQIGTGAPTAAGQMAGPPISQAPQAPPEAQGMPLPAVQPQMTQQYQQAKARSSELEAYKAQLDMDPFMPAEEKEQAIAALVPHVAQARALMKRYPPPKPPQTYEELVAAGPMQGGMTPVPGTFNYIIADGKGGTKISTAVHPDEGGSWRSIKDPVLRAEAKLSDLNAHRQILDDDVYLHDGKKWTKEKEDDEFDKGEYILKRAVQGQDFDKAVEEALELDRKFKAFDLRQRFSNKPGAVVLGLLGAEDATFAFAEAVAIFENPDRFIVTDEQRRAAGQHIITKLMELRNAGALSEEAKRDLEPLLLKITSQRGSLPLRETEWQGIPYE